MLNRYLSWLFLGACVALVSLRAQAPAGTAAMPEGLVLVAKVAGKVQMTVAGQPAQDIHVDDKIPQKAKVNTAADSSVVLVFSNGASTQLGADTELVIEEYLQDPFAATIKVADLKEEPSASKTKLALNRGELVGNVKKLRHDKGSTFTIQTPVGAAGIRGTTFRIVFRPEGSGQAFRFQLSTVEGNVQFQQPAAGGSNTPGAGTTNGTADVTQPAAPTQGATPAGGDANAPGTGTAANAPATPPAGGGTTPVAVTGGQEVVITVNVATTPAGQVVVTAPPQVVSTIPINAQTQAALVSQATSMATAAANATFTSPSPAPAANAGTGNTGTNGGGGNGTSDTSANGGGSSGTTGSTTGTTSGTTTGSTTGTTTGSTTPTSSNSTANNTPAGSTGTSNSNSNQANAGGNNQGTTGASNANNASSRAAQTVPTQSTTPPPATPRIPPVSSGP